MKLEKKISLHAFEVEYIDQREAKPRSLHRESAVFEKLFLALLDKAVAAVLGEEGAEK